MAAIEAAMASSPALSENEPMAEAAVRFAGVSVQYGGQRVLDQVDASVPVGSCTAIIGPNGAGKTTLLLALLGEQRYNGRIHIAPASARIGYVPQRLALDRGMPLTVGEFLAMGLQKKPLWFGISKALRDRGQELLSLVKAGHLYKRNVGALSGGELQRVLLALALQQDPQLLVLDELSAGVDPRGGLLFCELLDYLRELKKFTQLMVSHDLAVVTHHASHVICLNHRVIAEGPPKHIFTEATLTALFGIHMGLVNSQSMPNSQAACSASCCQSPKHA